MLGRWLKKKNKLDDPDPAVRLAAVEALDPQSDEIQQALAKLAQDDDSMDVRRAAIARLEQPALLDQLHQQTALAEQVAERKAAIIRTTGQWQWLKQEDVFALYLRDYEATDREQVLAQVSTSHQLVEFMLVLPHAQAEELLDHALLQSDEGLQALERLSRGRSKSINRYARQQLEQIKQCRTEFAAVEKRCREIDQSLKKENTDTTRLRKLLQLRRELETQTTALNDSHPLNSTTFSLPPAPLDEARLAEREQAAAAQAAAEQAARESKAQAVQAQQRATAEQAAQTEAAAQSSAAQQAEQRLQTPFWQQLDTSPPAIDPQGSIAAQSSARQAQLKTLKRELKTLQWPADMEAPLKLIQARALQDTLAAQLDTLREAADKLTADLEDQLQAIEQAIEAGQTQTVGSQIKNAREQLQRAPDTHPAARTLERKIAQLSGRLAELRDWQKFATGPKRQALLAELEQLAEHPEAPPLQADRLKDLRGRWQQLGRPTTTAEHEQQAEFDRIAEIAFEPCKAYFEQQNQLRADNLEQRIKLTDQLAQYLKKTDWTNADYKAAEQIMRTARQEWRRYHPCDRKALKPVQAQFEALQTELHGQLKAHWDANIAAKHNIVAEAQALLTETPEVNSIDEVKNLQRRWQTIGATPRSMDQRLWKDFRAACDEVFAARDAQKSEQVAQLQAQTEALSAAIGKLEQAAQRALADNSATRKELDQLNNEIDDLQAGIDAGRYRARLRDARTQYRQALTQVEHQARLAEVSQLKALDVELSAKEQAGETIAERGSDKSVDEDCLRLALEAEIAADLPSPQADQSARMALQIEFMNAGIRDLAERDHSELIARWNRIGPKNADHDPLRERFFDAILSRFSG